MALCKPQAGAQCLLASVELKDGTIAIPSGASPGTQQHDEAPVDALTAWRPAEPMLREALSKVAASPSDVPHPWLASLSYCWGVQAGSQVAAKADILSWCATSLRQCLMPPG